MPSQGLAVKYSSTLVASACVPRAVVWWATYSSLRRWRPSAARSSLTARFLEEVLQSQWCKRRRTRKAVRRMNGELFRCSAAKVYSSTRYRSNKKKHVLHDVASSSRPSTGRARTGRPRLSSNSMTGTPVGRSRHEGQRGENEPEASATAASSSES